MTTTTDWVYIKGSPSTEGAVRSRLLADVVEFQIFNNGAYSGDSGVGTPTTAWQFIYGRAGEELAVRIRLEEGEVELQQWYQGRFIGDGVISSDTTPPVFLIGAPAKSGTRNVIFNVEAGEPAMQHFNQGKNVGARFIKTTLALTTTLPSELTYTRANATGTYRDTNGDWQAAAANTPRFDHNASGTPLGQRFEPVRTNKVNHYNFSPTTIGNITLVSGTGTASIVDDSTEIANSATIDGSSINALSNGNAIEFTATANATFNVSIAAGNTNNHSYRVLIRQSTSGGYKGNVKLSNGVAVETFTFADTEYHEVTSEDFECNNAARTLQIYVTTGSTIYITGMQFEEGSFVTSPIISEVNDGTAARSLEVNVASNLDSAEWFNTDRGAIIADVTFDHVNGFDAQYVFLASNGTGLTDNMGIYLNQSASSQARARDIISSTNYLTDDIHRPIENKRFPVAISWAEGKSLAVAGPMSYIEAFRDGSPVDMDRIYIGGRPFTDTMSGWIKSVTVYNRYRSLKQLRKDMFPVTESYKAIVSGGQSNKEGWYRDQTTNLNGGEIAAITELDTVYSSSENWMINGALNGSYALKSNDPNADTATENWWYDDVTGEFGPRMEQWEKQVIAFGIENLQAIDWDQGESDSGTAKATLKAAWLAIFNRMRTVAGEKPVFITGIGRRSDYQDANYNTVREAQRELASENPWIYLNIEKFTQPLADQVHLTDAGYAAHAALAVPFMLDTIGETVSGDTQPPTITNVVRSTTTVTVTITHGDGADFTPTSAIAGFHFFDDGVEIPITAAVRTDATTITLTLDSAPTGVETFYYGYGSLYDEVSTFGNLVVDDGSRNVPLMSYAETL